jgi:tetratricopeptide (TPR) repeat protein
MLAEKMGRMDLLEADLKTVIKHDPTNADVLNALGYTLADRTNRYQEAHDYIKRALDLSPDNFYILDSMGWVLYRMGRLEESVQYLRRAKALNDDPEVSAHLSEVLWVKGDKEEAREVLDSALKTTPEDEKLLEVLKRLNP